MAQGLSLANLQLAMSQNNAKMKEWVTSLVGDVKTIGIKWVDALPTEGISTSTIYMVKSAASTEENNIYVEYVYKEGTGWEKFGTVDAGTTDLTGFYNKTEIDEMIANLDVTIENYTDEEVTAMVNGLWSE